MKRNGEVIQHTEYMAFGEVLVDEHSVSNKQPYLFNGKELDFETGLYYYGARYYDPRTSVFLNVDPLVEKTGTPYVYTYNNPVNFTDPTGMEEEPTNEKITTIQEVVITKRTSWWQRNIVDPVRNFFKGPIHYPTTSDQSYKQVNNNTLIAYQGVNQAPQYRFILPQDFGGWSQDDTASDGLIYKGCLSCHADNGAYRFAAYNSQERNTGEMAGAIIGAIAGNSMNGKGKINKFSGSERAWQEGATPNSIYTYLSSDKKTAVSNYIYNSEGKVIFQVDFQNHGKNWLSGHGHKMSIPGQLRSGHFPANHIPHNSVPSQYKRIPNGIKYSVPLAK